MNPRHSLIRARFDNFHAKNPQVYSDLLKLTRQAVEAKRNRIGIKMLFEILRWNHLLSTTGEPYKLSNDFTAHYARMIMQNHPEFGEIFDLRNLRA